MTWPVRTIWVMKPHISAPSSWGFFVSLGTGLSFALLKSLNVLLGWLLSISFWFSTSNNPINLEKDISFSCSVKAVFLWNWFCIAHLRNLVCFLQLLGVGQSVILNPFPSLPSVENEAYIIAIMCTVSSLSSNSSGHTCITLLFLSFVLLPTFVIFRRKTQELDIYLLCKFLCCFLIFMLLIHIYYRHVFRSSTFPPPKFCASIMSHLQLPSKSSWPSLSPAVSFLIWNMNVQFQTSHLSTMQSVPFPFLASKLMPICPLFASNLPFARVSVRCQERIKRLVWFSNLW